MANTLP
jgi:hypothetical protein